VKHYGIYIGYPPQVDLRVEGLGRHLAEFLRASQYQDEFRFVVACPSWSRSGLKDLCHANGIALDSFDIVSPDSEPFFLRTYRWWLAIRTNKRRSALKNFLIAFRQSARRPARTFAKLVVSTRNVPLTVAGGLAVIILAVALSPILVVGAASFFFGNKIRRGTNRLFSRCGLGDRLKLLGQLPQNISLVPRLYRLMEESEAKLLAELAEARTDVRAWFTPTAFWPQFNAIRRPRLTCVPDVVLTRFPVAFGKGDERAHAVFRQIERTIRGSTNLVVYSEDIKYRTLVDLFNVDRDRIEVIHHGANMIDHLITLKGTPDDAQATLAFCRNLFKSALRKARGASGSPENGAADFPFLFYASQFRPSKNIINLLRAYDHLLKRRYIGFKLVLTGRPDAMPEVGEFLDAHNLRNDVLCLHGLSNQEWAACYKLATLAINPTLAEGGCPFTFSEALSVGTPVVMSRIAVTEEVINDPEIQEVTFFDPYDWEDIASRIEWALANRDELYDNQRKYYENVVSQRTWQHVVREYVAILDRISASSNEPAALTGAS
jgi:glycosyltransferase involved in cell wall biosynthesis